MYRDAIKVQVQPLFVKKAKASEGGQKYKKNRERSVLVPNSLFLSFAEVSSGTHLPIKLKFISYHFGIENRVRK